MMLSRRAREQISANWFPLLCSVIVTISLFDTWLVVYFSDVIDGTEQNPVGRWLLDAAPGRVDVLVRTKLAGTLLAMSLLVMLRRAAFRGIFPVTASVATFQTGLLAYLCLA